MPEYATGIIIPIKYIFLHKSSLFLKKKIKFLFRLKSRELVFHIMKVVGTHVPQQLHTSLGLTGYSTKAALSIAVALVAWERKFTLPYCIWLPRYGRIYNIKLPLIVSPLQKPYSKKMKFYNKKLDADCTCTDKNGVSSMFGTTSVGKHAMLVLLYCRRWAVEKVSFIRLLWWDKSVVS